jgi:hypothetical protein
MALSILPSFFKDNCKMAGDKAQLIRDGVPVKSLATPPETVNNKDKCV